ncbi:MAG: cytochrome c oxidase subunit 3 [Phycisphaerae bacterium]
MADVAEHGHSHSPYLAHHFDTPVQQFDSGKLGMWLFLATEVLLFGGLFCAYSVYRANHPEIFLYAHKFLDPFWGGLNTVILLVSSFTMAFAVHCSQTNKRAGLMIGLALTLAGGAGFMSIKYVEYSHKFHDALLPGRNYNPSAEVLAHVGGGHGARGTHDVTVAKDGAAKPEGAAEHAGAEPSHAPAAAATAAPATQATTQPGQAERSVLASPAAAPAGLAASASPLTPHAGDDDVKNVHLFFGIYFLMTGLHGIHVLAGMGVIAYLLIKSIGGAYNSQYFTPVDLGGLYWHLVDLIWIYLFPLLYLIH